MLGSAPSSYASGILSSVARFCHRIPGALSCQNLLDKPLVFREAAKTVSCQRESPCMTKNDLCRNPHNIVPTTSLRILKLPLHKSQNRPSEGALFPYGPHLAVGTTQAY